LCSLSLFVDVVVVVVVEERDEIVGSVVVEDEDEALDNVHPFLVFQVVPKILIMVDVRTGDNLLDLVHDRGIRDTVFFGEFLQDLLEVRFDLELTHVRSGTLVRQCLYTLCLSVS